MKHLKLVINNEEKPFFFNKKELKKIFDLYAKMVTYGYCKDYSISISKSYVSFNFYKRFSDSPVFQINKCILKKNKDIYILLDKRIDKISRSNDLNKLIDNLFWKTLKLVR